MFKRTTNIRFIQERISNILFLFIVFLASTVFHATVTAASFRVDPVRANLSMETTTSTFELSNTGSENALIQVYVKKWFQDKGIDRLEDTQDIVAIPSVFKMAAGKKQTIRIGLLDSKMKTKITDTEQSYRIFFEELPEKNQSEDMNMRLQVSIPIFIAPSVELKPKLKATDFNVEEQSVLISNTGNQHIQIFQFLGKSENEIEVKAPSGTYFLPGQTRRLLLQTQGMLKMHDLNAIETDVAGVIPYGDSSNKDSE